MSDGCFAAPSGVSRTSTVQTIYTVTLRRTICRRALRVLTYGCHFRRSRYGEIAAKTIQFTTETLRRERGVVVPQLLLLAHGVEPLDVLLALLDDLVALQHARVLGVLALVVVLHHVRARPLALRRAPRREQRAHRAREDLGRADQLLADLPRLREDISQT